MQTFTAFAAEMWLATGTREEIIATLRTMPEMPRASDILVFDDETGKQVDFDLRDAAPVPVQPATRGRPRLGVAAREVTLLPRHWDWLRQRPGGASAELRRLVDAAMKAPPSPRAGRDAAYQFLSAIAGDRDGYEEAVRAIYRDDRDEFARLTATWPPAVRDHAIGLAWRAAETT